jgi:hypothetical protein
MPFQIFDYVDEQGRNDFKTWSKKLQPRQRARLDEKITLIELYDTELYSKLFSDAGIKGILKIKINIDGAQLRPLFCRGPIHAGKEYTFLLGAKERDWKLLPLDALNISVERKKLVIVDPATRRIKHERVI